MIQRVVRGYKYIHRTSTTLRKPGQYQDLMLLSSRGVDRPFTYLDERFGGRGRRADLPLFGFGANVTNDQGLSEFDFHARLRDLEARGRDDVADLRQAGRTHRSAAESRYRYTVLFDADNRAPAGAVRSLIEIAAANPDRGFFQTGLLISNLDTWHSFREILALSLIHI